MGGEVLLPSKTEPGSFIDGGERRNIVAFQDTLLDLDSGETLEHTPDFFNFTVLPYNFDPDAKCERWARFLKQVMNDDLDCIRLLQEIVGYCLIPTTIAQRAVIFLRAGGQRQKRLLQTD